MGQGGWLSLINATPYAWHRGYNHSYDMDMWDFPVTVSPGELAQVYVERNNGPDAAAEVNYTIPDPDTSAIQIQYSVMDDGSATTYVRLETIGTKSTPERGEIRTGFGHNVVTPFVLAGEAASSFVSSDAPADWMHQGLDHLGCLPLRHLCIPGSHNAGMSMLDGHTFFANEGNTLTQKLDIGEQLYRGTRYFDIRPVKAAGVFKTGHYSGGDVTLALNTNDFNLDDLDFSSEDLANDPALAEAVAGGRQGANGESISTIIEHLNNFTVNNNELIILKLSHAYDTDDGYDDLTQAQWDSLLDQMSKINFLFHADTTIDLTTLPLAAYIQNSPAVVVLVGQGGVDLKQHAGRGFFSTDQFDIYDRYSNTDVEERMIEDQLAKLQKRKPTRDSRYFLLSYTLTQPWWKAGAGPSILHMADDVFDSLFRADSVWSVLSNETYPNIILMDSLPPDGKVKAFALAINRYFAPQMEGLHACAETISARSWERPTSWLSWLTSLV